MIKFRPVQYIIENLLINGFIHDRGVSGMPVVFLHGWRSRSQLWFNVLSRLQERPLICIDLPGFGQSQTPAIPFGLDDYARVVRDFLGKCAVNKYILVGHSFGGSIAARMAIQKANGLNKLVLVDASAIRKKNPKHKSIKLLSLVARPLFRLPGFKKLRTRIYERMGMEDYVATPALTETYKKVISQNLEPELPRITCPTLIIWGEKDTETPLSQANEINTLIKNSRLEVMDTGHFPFVDKPEEFSRILADFIKP